MWSLLVECSLLADPFAMAQASRRQRPRRCSVLVVDNIRQETLQMARLMVFLGQDVVLSLIHI